MDALPFILVITSAVSHAYWNFLTKKSSDTEAFIWWMNFISLFTSLPIFYLLISNWSFPMIILPYLVVSGIAEAFYFLTLGWAYRHGDLSIIYPLARSSPLFLFVLAVIFLGEELSLNGVVGILVVMLGVYMIHLRSFSSRDFLKPIASLRTRASQFALLTALSTAIYSIADKLGVEAVPPLTYAFWLDLFVTAFLTPLVILRRKHSMITYELKRFKIQIIVGGFLMRIGYVLVLVAMSLTQVTYILSIRQLSIIIGVFLGVKLLGEKYGRVRLLSSAMILIGALILGLMT